MLSYFHVNTLPLKKRATAYCNLVRFKKKKRSRGCQECQPTPGNARRRVSRPCAFPRGFRIAFAQPCVTWLDRAHSDELLFARIVSGHHPSADVVHPAVKFQVPLFQMCRDCWVSMQIFELFDHITLRERE